jgi:hypothetical protein
MYSGPSTEYYPSMNKPIQLRGLFETHLTVSDLQQYIRFYCDKVGLRLAYEAPARGRSFLRDW